jgi:hypothetical protein
MKNIQKTILTPLKFPGGIILFNIILALQEAIPFKET